MTPTLSVDSLEVFEEALNLVLIKPADTQPFQQGSSRELPTACYAFSKAGKTLVAAAVSKPDDTSFARTVGVEPEVLFVAVVMMAVAVVM